MSSATGFELKVDKYLITADAYQYILQEKKTVTKEGKTSGKEYYGNIKYYPTLEQVVGRILDNKVKESSVSTVAEVRDRFKEITEYIKLIMSEIDAKIKLGVGVQEPEPQDTVQ